MSTSGGVIQELLRAYVKDINARAAVLISSSGLVFGTYGKTVQEEEMLKNSASYLQNLYLFHLQTGLQPDHEAERGFSAGAGRARPRGIDNVAVRRLRDER